MKDEQIGQLMNEIVGSVEIEDPKFAFNLIKENLEKAHQEGAKEKREKINVLIDKLIWKIGHKAIDVRENPKSTYSDVAFSEVEKRAQQHILIGLKKKVNDND